MRNLFVVILLITVYLLSGFFTVDEREVAVVSTSPNRMTIYAPGLHWKTPFVGDLTYVYMNMRSSYLTTSPVFHVESEGVVATKIIVNWQVVLPQTYLKLILSGEKNFETQFTRDILAQVEKIASKSTSLTNLEEQVNSQIVNQRVESLGIQLINIGITELTLANDESLNESSPVPLITKQNSIESAYVLAQNIKQVAESEHAQLIHKLKSRNAEFYNYFEQINHLAKTAVDKKNVPPLDRLYPVVIESAP